MTGSIAEGHASDKGLQIMLIIFMLYPYLLCLQAEDALDYTE